MWADSAFDEKLDDKEKQMQVTEGDEDDNWAAFEDGDNAEKSEEK